MQPMSTDLLEQLVLAKPYFENAGLIVAVDDGEPVGFVHAAFGPNDDESGLSRMLGVTCLVMVRADYQRRGIGADLLTHSEAYLRERGAQVLYAGGIRPLNGFYLGLYGGSELPGVLDSTPRAQRLFAAQGYREIDRVRVLHRDLAGFRALVDRPQMQIRRRTTIQVTCDPPSRTWWEACTYGGFDRMRFDLLSRPDGAVLATATFWGLEPLASSWGVHAVGLIDVKVDPAQTHQGLATFLLGDAFRQLQTQGISLVEVQAMQHNSPAQGLYRKLGFQEVDQGQVLRKEE
jgi:GNAT superfamily N-acetyltransferase